MGSGGIRGGAELSKGWTGIGHGQGRAPPGRDGGHDRRGARLGSEAGVGVHRGEDPPEWSWKSCQEDWQKETGKEVIGISKHGGMVPHKWKGYE